MVDEVGEKLRDVVVFGWEVRFESRGGELTFGGFE